MVGIIDAGGGMRGVYSTGIYDYLSEHHYDADYGIGVSAGAANMICLFSGQPGRAFTFYREYTFRKEYMGVSNWLKQRDFINLDYIYSVLTNSDGENPLDFPALMNSRGQFLILATDAETGEPVFFSKEDMSQDNYEILKASSAIPAACRPRMVNGRYYFDGGVSCPLPYEKAFSDGCDRLVVIITKPKDFVKPPQKNMGLIKMLTKKYPVITELVARRHEIYNKQIAELTEMEKSGKVLLIGPDDSCGVDTFVKDREAYVKLHDKGYCDGKTILDYIQNG